MCVHPCRHLAETHKKWSADFIKKKNVKSLDKWFSDDIIEIDMLQTRVSLDAALRPLTVCAVFLCVSALLIYLGGLWHGF